jgi:two-component system cell cycle sensor histidine kinase/response regulator CckA
MISTRHGDSKLKDDPILEKGTILVVEDHDPVRKVVEYTLRHAGYNVIVASNAEQVFDIIETIKDTGVDLIIADVVLPKMDGRELVARLEQIMPDVKSLYISGYPENAIVKHVIEEELPFLDKPFSMNDILDKVREVLDR